MAETQMQPRLISLELPEAQAILELFPDVWLAAEQLGSPDVKLRHEALDKLLKMNAARISPLVAYLLTTRILDPNLEIRARIVEAVANVMRRDADGQYAVDTVRSHIIAGLSYFGTVGIMALLELALNDEALLPHINKLLNFSPKAGNHLKNLAADRDQEIEIRRHAIFFIGKIGYVNAVNELIRIRNRIETKQEGQKRMSFAPPISEDRELELLEEIKKTLAVLGAD